MKEFEFAVDLKDSHKVAVDEQDIAYWRSQNPHCFAEKISDIEIAEIIAIDQARKGNRSSSSTYSHKLRRLV